MRLILLAASAAALAGPAAAQDLNSWQIDQLRMEQELARQRAVAMTNELTALEARQRAEQAVRDLQFSRAVPMQAPALPYVSSYGATAPVDMSKLPSVPEAALAESNRRVQDAARNRR